MIARCDIRLGGADTTTVTVIQEVEAQGSLRPRRWKSAWAKQPDPFLKRKREK